MTNPKDQKVKCVNCFYLNPVPVRGLHICLIEGEPVDAMCDRRCHVFSYLPPWTPDPETRQKYKHYDLMIDQVLSKPKLELEEEEVIHE
ncbi:MAG: hypothetical protein AB1540_15240 [Bdellovibrionota bacterium]